MERWPLWRGGRYGEVAVEERWSLWRGGCCGEVAVMERWPLRRGGRCGEVAVVERWPLWRVGRCREMAVVERWPLVEVQLYFIADDIPTNGMQFNLARHAVSDFLTIAGLVVDFHAVVFRGLVLPPRESPKNDCVGG